MKYTKPPLTFDDHANLLISRGLKCDKQELISRLQSVNYYRLSAYLYPFRKPDDSFRENTTFDLVWKHYVFDRQLRILVMDAIERIEVAVRTKLAYHFSHKFSAFGYTDKLNLPKIAPDKFDQWIEELDTETKRAKEAFIDHFFSKYGDSHKQLPLWMVVEIMSFGKTLTFFNGVEDGIRRTIAREFGVEDMILQSWLGALNVVRNICAHHGRLWNRELGFKPYIPKAQKYPEWHIPITIPNNRVFGILSILKYMLDYSAPSSNWEERLHNLLKRYPEISIKSMGFPVDWEKSPVWQ